MEKYKSASKILILLSGIFVTVVSFIFYWVAFGITKTQESSIDTYFPLLVLVLGILGGVLLFVSSFFVKTTRWGGSVVSTIGTLFSFACVFFLIFNLGEDELLSNAIFIILPFFVMSLALGFGGSVTALAISISSNKKE